MTKVQSKYNSSHSVAQIRQLIYTDLDLALLEAQARGDMATVLDIEQQVQALFNRMEDLWEPERSTRAKTSALRGLEAARNRIARISPTATVFDRAIALDAARCDSKKSIMALEKCGVK